MATNYSTMWKNLTGQEEPITSRYEKRGIFPSVFDIPIYLFTNFNAKNYQYMQLHMLRNLQERHITLNNLGENAYANGDGRNFGMSPMQPYYVEDNNYVEFVKKNIIAEQDGQLVTRLNNRDNTFFQTSNKYIDISSTDKGITFTGDGNVDKNSILYKTKKLWNTKKLKTIVSAFHTDPTLRYTGQVGYNEYGESHGRNLLKYDSDPENGLTTSPIEGDYGYDNPYCRVWTHYHQYDKFCKTMRAQSKKMNYWDEDYFDWSDEEIAKYYPEYLNSGVKPYAWHGKANQDRRSENSVLDYETGLVNITPKFRNNGNIDNIHTKRCMFSIENLAWKDYDPYSFEQALSWEQRGPMGGRIMWFPPYDLQINETTNANWQSHDFIGRGEKLYTYTNTERTGNLSFLMLTDHPASVDYASWYSDSNELNSDNDYLRYFAGCNDGKPTDGKIVGNSISVDGGNNDINRNTTVKENNDMLIKRPPTLFDEYEQFSGVSIHAPEIDQITPESVPDVVIQTPVEPQEQTVEFVVYYPNNYSGKYDLPSNSKSNVHSINYLLLGISAQRQLLNNNKFDDIPLLKVIKNTQVCGNGYEMLGNGISMTDYENSYIIGAKKENTNIYVADERKKWYYRIDFQTDENGNYKVGKSNKFYINQSLHDTTGKVSYNNNPNYIDNKNFGLNLKVSDYNKGMYENLANAYSLAEFACAFYEIQKNEIIVNHLKSKINDDDKINNLVKILSNYDLTKIDIQGISTSQGYSDNNEDLANHRAQSISMWLKEFDKWKNIESNITTTPGAEISKNEKFNVNGKRSKLNRAAKVKLTFALAKTNTVTESTEEPVNATDTSTPQPKEYKEFVGFKYQKTDNTPYGKWDYYKRDTTVKYYEQIGGDNNTSNTTNNDVNGDKIVVKEEQINNVMKTLLTLMEYTPYNPNYRGVFNNDGTYKDDNDDWYSYKKDDIVKYEDKYYIFIKECYSQYEFKTDLWEKIGDYLDNEIPFDSDTVYAGDYIFYDNTYYIAKEDIIFNNDNMWVLVEEIEWGKQYYQGDYVLYEGNVYEFIVDGFMEFWETDKVVLAESIQFSFLQPVIKNTLVKNGDYYYVSSVNTDYTTSFYPTDIKPIETNILFDNNKTYDKNELIIYNEIYYQCKVNSEIYSNSAIRTTFDGEEWEEYNDNTYIINEFSDEILLTVVKSLSTNVQDYLIKLFGDKYNFITLKFGNGKFWEYGKPDFLTSEYINETANLLEIVQGIRGKLNLEDSESNFLYEYEDNYNILQDWIMCYIRTNYIINFIDEIILDNGVIVDTKTGKMRDEVETLIQKSYFNIDNNDCKEEFWVNRGDGVLVRECEILALLKNPYALNKERKDVLNKIRYDQEYMFYKQYMCDHPFIFQKLQEKVKYFNPAFHSMTPEGFNARLTFLHQCTRQGNTKTMSDVGGKTANNLAFGRPPFCVLRLGDFYNQLIVIDSISFDYNVDSGLQWDLNPEGNGVQPMLCKVNISFKFIGGGDITGPVRRLQNAMSFNYYANASFYDNRADRVSYGDTNYQTMGGAGNNEIDYSKSYAYQPKMYSQDNNKHIKFK